MLYVTLFEAVIGNEICRKEDARNMRAIESGNLEDYHTDDHMKDCLCALSGLGVCDDEIDFNR